MRNLKTLLAGAVTSLLFFSTSLHAQDDLLNTLKEEAKPETVYTFATFKGTRVVNLQSPELPGKGVLQFMILHRFGAFNDNFFYNFMGLDNAQVRLALDYSVFNWLSVGVAHSGIHKTYEGFLKYRLVRQSTGKKNFPFSIVGFSSLIYSAERAAPDQPIYEGDRFNYVHELVLARKFTPGFSAEIVPSLVHFNLVDSIRQNNDVFALGIGARQKLTPMTAISIEYIHQFNPNNFLDNGSYKPYADALSVGFVIETGGHVFQLFLSNAIGVSEPYVFAQNTGRWENGNIHLGFNISRVFTIQKPKTFKEE